VHGQDEYFFTPPPQTPSDSRFPPGWSPLPPKRRRNSAERVSGALTEIASSWWLRLLVLTGVSILVAIIRAVWPG
jgi:hypothetical protein